MKLLYKFFLCATLILACAFYFALLGKGPAYAHGVYIYAWAGPDEICTDSYFNRKSKVKNGEIQALTPDGNLLFKAHTDDEGKACFPLPDEAMDIEFVVLAGEGHKAYFKLRAEDIAPYIRGEISEAKSIDRFVEDENHPFALKQNSELLRQIVREELKLQLKPLFRHLSDQEDKSPGLRDIFAGLGWIIAIAAIAYIVMRRPSNRV